MYSKPRNNANKAPPKISRVTLALQLISGERLVGEFSPEKSLWSVLTHWEEQGKLEPQLKSLAADIPVCIYSRQEISSVESLKDTTLLRLGILNGKVVIRYLTKPEGIREQPHVGGILAHNPRPPTPEASPLQAKEVDVSTPEDTKEREECISDITPKSEEMPEAINEPTRETCVEPEETVPEKTCGSDPGETPKTLQSVTPDIPSEQIEDQHIIQLNERGDLIYRRPESDPSTVRRRFEEETDDFFELTDTDVHRMYHDLTQRRMQMENAPVLTAQLRQEQAEQRRQQILAKYPVTVLRVQFTDGLVLQMPLPSTTNLAEVKQILLKTYISGPENVDDFLLYKAPPKEVLENYVSLHELGLTPTSLIYIGSNKANCRCVIRDEYKETISSYLGAVNDVSKRLRKDDTINEAASTSEAAAHSDPNATQPRRPAHSTSSNPPPSGTVPKWLKLKR